MSETISSFVLMLGTGAFFFGLMWIIVLGASKNLRGSLFDSPVYTFSAIISAINEKQWKPFALMFLGIILILAGSLNFSNLFK